MRSTRLVCIATIAAMGFGTAAQAQEWRGHESHEQRQQQRQDQRQQRQEMRIERHAQAQVQAQPQQQWQQRRQWQQPQQQYQRQWTAPSYQQRYVQPQYSQPNQYHAYNNYAPRTYSHGYYGAPQYRTYGGGYGHYGSRYYVGGYAPVYASHRYWINDWRARHLYAPPYGYQWVETDTGDVLLLALATGLIANAILAQ